METSALKARLCKNHKRRVINSSDEEEVERPSEVDEQQSVISQEPIPCTSSTPVYSDSGSSHDKGSRSGIVIDMIHDNVDSPWDSEIDDQDSATSTPGYKCGRHTDEAKGKHGKHMPKREKAHSKRWDMTMQNRRQPTDGEIVRMIEREGIRHDIPTWITCRTVRHSVLVLADSQLKYWPNMITSVELSSTPGL